MKHCNHCHKDEPEVSFYEYRKTMCKDRTKRQVKNYYYGELAKSEVQFIGLAAKERHKLWLKKEADKKEALINKITRAEQKLHNQAKQCQGKIVELNYFPLFQATHKFLDSIGTRY